MAAVLQDARAELEIKSDLAHREAQLSALARHVEPLPSESAGSFAARVLARLSPVRALDFGARLAASTAAASQSGRALRLLSLGSGCAVAEAALLKYSGDPIEIVLADRDESALHDAMTRLGRHFVRCRKVDPEMGLRGEEPFDVVFSLGALSRLVRLQPMLEDLKALTRADGELWIAREYVGRPGFEMDDGDRARADQVFRELPARLRRHAIDGTVHAGLPHAPVGRHGARHGTQLLHWVRQYFTPVEEHFGNSLLWRVLDSAYAVNFDLAGLEDRDVVRKAVISDVLHTLFAGGRPVMLDGVYRAAPH